MERSAAMVTSHRAAPASASASAPAPAGQEVKGKGKGKRKGKVVEEDAAYLSIQLEEIVIVKNDDDASLGIARGHSTLAGGAASTGQRVEAVAALRQGMSAARGALSTTVGWIVGSDD